MAKKLKEKTGQAIVEFALVLPLLLTLLLGVIDFGWIYVNRYGVERAAASAARYGAIHVNRYKESANRADYLGAVKSKALESLPEGAEGAEISINVSQSAVTVTVSYPVRTLSFVAGTIYGNSYTASAKSVASY